MASDEKFCPVMICAHEAGGRCIGLDCAWWCDFAKDCSIPLLAGMFADSEICRNVFEEGESDGKLCFYTTR